MNTDGHGGRSAGFTLVELMIVMGLVVLLIGGFSLAGQQASDQTLRSAQLQVASLIERTRLMAVSQQSNARLVIDAGDSDHFMRVLQVFSQDAAGNWNAASPAAWLTRGTTVVPPVGLTGGVAPWDDFSDFRSVLALDLAPRLPGEEFEGATRTAYVEYAPNGSLRKSAVNPARVAVAALITTSAGTLVAASIPPRWITILENGTVALETGFPP